jgi:predicted ArsR family transcriptional regulator
VLHNCPFDSLRGGCRDVICGMNLALIEGLLAGLGLSDVRAKLEPQPGTCCVALRPSEPTGSGDPAPTPG